MRLLACVAAPLLLALACKEPGEPDPVVQITMATLNDSVMIGSTKQVVAFAVDGNGNPVSGNRLRWESANTNFATVDDNGVVTGVAAGIAGINVAADGRTASMTMTVQRPVNLVVVAPPTMSLQTNQSRQLTVTTTDVNGQTLNGRVITFSTSNPLVATVTGTGVVSAIAAGQATITAASEGKQGTSVVTVIPAVASVAVAGAGDILVGQQVQYTATPRDAQGQPLSLIGRTIQWESSNIPVATVSGAGVVVGQSPGSAVITAIVDGVPGQATVNVSNVPVAAVTLNTNAVNIPVNGTFQLVATPRDNLGNPLPNRPAAWASSNEAVATVSTLGLVTAKASGVATITVIIEGKSAQATVTVP